MQCSCVRIGRCDIESHAPRNNPQYTRPRIDRELRMGYFPSSTADREYLRKLIRGAMPLLNVSPRATHFIQRPGYQGMIVSVREHMWRLVRNSTTIKDARHKIFQFALLELESRDVTKYQNAAKYLAKIVHEFGEDVFDRVVEKKRRDTNLRLVAISRSKQGQQL